MKNFLGSAITISKIKPLFYFSTKVKSSNSLPAKYLSEQQSNGLQEDLGNLQKNLSTFNNNFQLYSQIAKNSPLAYVALFARSCLIADINNTIKQQKYYPIIKKAINQDKYELNPHTCIMLLECFSYFKWEGDQGNIIEKLCSYYEKNSCLFQQNQQGMFWENYMKIMAQKAHSSIKFRDLKRKQKQTLQFSSIKTITQQLNLKQISHKLFIKNITYQQQKNQIFLVLQKLSLKVQKQNSPKQNFQIFLKIKCILDFNQFNDTFVNDLRLSNEFEIVSKIMNEIKQFNSNFKKGWNTILYGNIVQRDKKQQNKVRYQYRQKDGYVGSQKIQDKLIVDEQTLNNQQKRNELKISNRFIKGIFYNSTNPRKRRIDTFTTLLLSKNTSYIAKCSLIFFNQNPHCHTSLISPFLTTYQLKQLYAYTKICQFHQSLYNSYTKIQNFINFLKQKQLQKKYEIDKIRQQIDKSQASKQMIKKYLAQQTQLLTQFTLQKANKINKLFLQTQYIKNYKKVYKFIGNYGADIFWQAKPYFGDVLRIMNQVQKLANIAIANKQKNVKIKIITYKYTFPHLIKHIVEGKYWTVPQIKFRNTQQIKIKQYMLSEIFNQNKSQKNYSGK